MDTSTDVPGSSTATDLVENNKPTTVSVGSDITATLGSTPVASNVETNMETGTGLNFSENVPVNLVVNPPIVEMPMDVQVSTSTTIASSAPMLVDNPSIATIPDVNTTAKSNDLLPMEVNPTPLNITESLPLPEVKTTVASMEVSAVVTRSQVIQVSGTKTTCTTQQTAMGSSEAQGSLPDFNISKLPDVPSKTSGEIDQQVSPGSVSSGSRSRKSSQSSKSPKAISPGSSPLPRSKKNRPPPPIKDEVLYDGRNDFYCWVCHKEGEVLCCELCPRVFHAKCLHMNEEPEGDWFCPECQKVMEAECKETQSKAMSQLSIDQLALHLRYGLQRMKTTGCEPFLEPVNTTKFNDYLDYVFHPMDLSTLEKNVKKRKYGCTEAFVADVKWILHNCIIYNGLQTKLTNIAKSIVKICEHEMSEIEVCPECYLNSCRKRENWFCEPCKEPHLLVWAKLQGFPHWPAKALRIDKGMVDCRFFGQHDRAWIALSGCYLMSKEMPFPVKNKKKGRGPGAKGGLDNAMQEAQQYIDNVTRKNGTFEYHPLRTPVTHLDLYRRASGTQSATDVPLSVKREAVEGENKQPISSVLGLKLANNGKAESSDTPPTLGTNPPKKKSKVVTTSGAHPGGAHKGNRSFAPKKRATMALLEKTIESCKASLLDSMHEGDEDSSSDESDSSSDESNADLASSNKSTPTSANKEEKTDNPSIPETNRSSKAPGQGRRASDDSDDDLVMDIADDDEASKKKASKEVLSSQLKGLVKMKKKSEGEKSKPKSILLNKDSTNPKITDTPVKVPASVGVKRKIDEDGAQSTGAVKARKVDGTSKPADGSPKVLGKVPGAKEKKKHLSDVSKRGKLDSEKPRKVPEAHQKTKKDSIGLLSQSSNAPKVPGASEGTKRATVLPSDAKSRSDDGQNKTGLKSAAKILSQKVMSRKLGPERVKPHEKSSTERAKIASDKPPQMDPAKKLAAFTIPKHKNPPSISKPPEPDQSRISPVGGNSNRSRQSNVTFPVQRLEKYNDKVMQGVRQVLMEMYEDMVTVFEGSKEQQEPKNEAMSQQVTQLRLELERLKWMHQQEIAELQHNHDLTIAEIRQSLDNEKSNLLEEVKRKAESEKKRAVDEAKRKQWCANCGKEALLYCCWNTTYCDYPCQQLHWPKHVATCSQAKDPAPASGGAAAAMHDNVQRKISRDPEVAPTPASPVTPIPPTRKESLKETDDDSDNDDMVIDESSHKDDVDVKNIAPQSMDFTSPASPEMSVPENTGLKKNAVTVSSASQNPSSTTTTTSSVETATSTSAAAHSAISRSTFPEVKAVSLPTTAASALSSEMKSKQLPSKASSNGSSASSSASVVPSKLLDDIFLKVVKKENRNDAKNPATTEPESTAQVATGEVTNTAAAATSKPESKHAGSGSAISAISDRLLKARQQVPTAGGSVASEVETEKTPTVKSDPTVSIPTPKPSEEATVNELIEEATSVLPSSAPDPQEKAVSMPTKETDIKSDSTDEEPRQVVDKEEPSIPNSPVEHLSPAVHDKSSPPCEAAKDDLPKDDSPKLRETSPEPAEVVHKDTEVSSPHSTSERKEDLLLKEPNKETTPTAQKSMSSDECDAEQINSKDAVVEAPEPAVEKVLEIKGELPADQTRTSPSEIVQKDEKTDGEHMEAEADEKLSVTTPTTVT